MDSGVSPELNIGEHKIVFNSTRFLEAQDVRSGKPGERGAMAVF